MDTKWTHIVYIIGVIALIIGAIDPLEGSIIIAVGCTLVAQTTYLTRDRHWKIFLASFIMIVFGVCFLFYFSTLGGFGGKSTLSWWWGTLILPYPIGWLMAVITLIVRTFHKKKHQTETPLNSE